MVPEPVRPGIHPALTAAAGDHLVHPVPVVIGPRVHSPQPQLAAATPAHAGIGHGGTGPGRGPPCARSGRPVGLPPLPRTAISRRHKSTSLRRWLLASYRIPASSPRRIPVAVSTVRIAASRRWATELPWEASSRADSLFAAQHRHQQLLAHLGGAQPGHQVRKLLFLGEPAEELLQRAELVAGVGVAVPGQQVDQSPLHVVAADPSPTWCSWARGIRWGGGEPLHCFGVSPHRLAAAPAPPRLGELDNHHLLWSATASASSGLRCWGRGCGRSSVLLSSAGSAGSARTSARQRFRRSRELNQERCQRHGIFSSCCQCR